MTPNRRPWLIPTIAAVAFFVAGVVAWRMSSGLSRGTAAYGHRNPSVAVFYFTPGPHRLHPLRAELLWAASALFALLAISVSRRRRSDTAPTVTA